MDASSGREFLSRFIFYSLRPRLCGKDHLETFQIDVMRISRAHAVVGNARGGCYATSTHRGAIGNQAWPTRADPPEWKTLETLFQHRGWQQLLQLLNPCISELSRGSEGGWVCVGGVGAGGTELIWKESGGRQSGEGETLVIYISIPSAAPAGRQPVRPNKQPAEGGRLIITSPPPHLLIPYPGSHSI